MLVVLPALHALFLSAALFLRIPSLGLRGALVYGSIATAAPILVITELLSGLGSISTTAVAVFWTGSTVVSFTAVLLARREWAGRTKLGIRLSVPEAVILLPVALLLLITALVAVIAPPNAIDALMYHLPRVMQWQQNQSLAFFPTSFPPQLYHPPLAEFVMLHLVLLSGGDHLVNLVAWLSYAGTVVAVSLVARELGASPLGQALAAFVCATIPLAIVQASGPKNDLVVGYWLVCLTWLVLRGGARPGLALSVLMGITFGLAIYTKANAALFGLPLAGALYLAVVFREPRSLATLLRTAVIVAAIAGALSAPHAFRNYDLFGSPLGPTQDGPDKSFAFRTSVVSLPYVTSNVVRTLAVQLATPWNGINHAIETGVRELHRFIGVDVNDKRTTWGNDQFYLPRAEHQDDWTSNPLQTLLIVGTMASFLLPGRGRGSLTQFAYAAGLTVGFLGFCALITWQLSAPRYQIPLIFLWAPLIALRLVLLPLGAIISVALVLLVGAAQALLFNGARPVLGEHSIFSQDRFTMMMARRPSVAEGYVGATDFVKQRDCPDIGLSVEWNEAEYAFWMLLPEISHRGHLDHVVVRNESERLSPPRPDVEAPCAIISTNTVPTEIIQVRDAEYEPAWAGNNIYVYLPGGTAPRVGLPYTGEYASEPPRQWAADERERYEVTLTNRGTKTWTAQDYALNIYFVGASDDSPSGERSANQRFSLPADVAPGETVIVSANVRAPERPGKYVLRHQVVKTGSFGLHQLEKFDVDVRRSRSR